MAVGILDALVSATGSGTNPTVNYTVSAGSNRRVVMILFSQDNTNQPVVTAKTLDGQVATQDVLSQEFADNITAAIFSTLETDIATGVGKVASMTLANSADWAIAVYVLNNNAQAAAEDSGEDSDTGADVTVNLTATVGSLQIGGLAKRGVAAVTEGANQTQRLEIAFSGETAQSSTQTQSGGTAMTESWSGAVRHAYAAVSYAGIADVFVPSVIIF